MTLDQANAMYINQYLKQVVDEQLAGDASRFDELWERVPNFSEVLRGFNSDSNWLHWTKKTYDGWYCVPSSASGFDVYYQERGSIGEISHFDDERSAVRHAMNASVFISE